MKSMLGCEPRPQRVSKVSYRGGSEYSLVNVLITQPKYSINEAIWQEVAANESSRCKGCFLVFNAKIRQSKIDFIISF